MKPISELCAALHNITTHPDRLSYQEDEITITEAIIRLKYLDAKLSRVIPVFQDARDAITHLSRVQVVVHKIDPLLASRMDEAGTYSITDWMRDAPNTSIS